MNRPDHPWGRYLALLGRVEAHFRNQVKDFGELITCRPGCDDCCQAPFRLSSVEAFSLRLALESLPRPERRSLLRRAEKGLAEADEVFGSLPPDPAQAARELALRRLPCPLLSQGRCALYFARPLTCRLYGLPTSSHGLAHTCPKNGFVPGRTYPTMDLDKVAALLADISAALLSRAGLPPRTEPLPLARALLSQVPDGCRPPAD